MSNVNLKSWFLDGLKQHFVHIYCTGQLSPKTEVSSSDKKLKHSLDSYLDF